MPAAAAPPTESHSVPSVPVLKSRIANQPDERLSPGDFELFIHEYSGRLLSVAKRLLRSDHDAADAVQDAFLSAFVSRHRFNGDSTVYTWLYRIVVNTCLMKIRRSQSQTVSLCELTPAFDGRGRHSGDVALREGNVAHSLEAEETRTLVRACIDRLPDASRAVLLLRDIDGFDTDETADLLQLSRSAVKTRLHRARAALRTLLADRLAS